MGRLSFLVGLALALSLVAAASGANGVPEVVARVQTGVAPCSETGGFGYLWVGNNGAGTISRVDPATNTVTATIGVGRGPCGVAVGAGAVWVDGYGSSSVIRVNPTTLKVVKRIHRPDQIWDVAFGAGAVWATETNLGYVDRINPKLNKVRRRIRIPGFVGPANLRYAAGAVWVGAQVGRKIYRIDVRTNHVTSIRVGDGPRGLAATAAGIWVANRLSGTVSRIDPRTRSVAPPAARGTGPKSRRPA